MTNILATIVAVIVTNITTQYETVGHKPIPCPNNKPSVDGMQSFCAVYHCESVYSTTDYTETRTVASNTYAVITVDDITWSNLVSSAQLQVEQRKIKLQPQVLTTSSWERVEADRAVWATNTLYRLDNRGYGSP